MYQIYTNTNIQIFADITYFRCLPRGGFLGFVLLK